MKALAFCSILAACALLVDPYSLASTFYDFDFQSWLVPSLPPANNAMESLPECPELNSTLSKERDSVTAEIQSRINQQNTLFTLKFTIVGGIFGALFGLLKDPARNSFEDLVGRRRSLIFVSASALMAGVIDTQFRLNTKIMIALGTWVREYLEKGCKGWEVFFHDYMSSHLPILRNMSLLPTALIYALAVTMFMILPRKHHDTARLFAKVVAPVFFLLLTTIGVSYYDERIRGTWKGLAVVLGLLGWLSIFMAERIKGQTDLPEPLPETE